MKMDALYLFACRQLWRKGRVRIAGDELMNALRSSDPELQMIAAAMLNDDEAPQSSSPVEPVGEEFELAERL
jgi:hypothetical protein